MKGEPGGMGGRKIWPMSFVQVLILSPFCLSLAKKHSHREREGDSSRTAMKAPPKSICGNDQTMFKFNLTKWFNGVQVRWLTCATVFYE